jgi:SAM-dependent methyltransferase
MQQYTAAQFGREWQTFDRLLQDFSQVFLEYFDLVNLDSLGKKTVLDAGCGMGRWAFHLAPKTHRIVAFDLSFSVEPAYKNCYEKGNVEVIQADIFHPPLNSRSFDFIYCLGVLHHLPDPFAGFLSLKELLSDSGELLVYVYYNLENKPFYFRGLKRAVDLMRHLTTRAPASVSYPAALAVATGIYLPLVWYGHLLSKMGLQEADRKIPLYQTYKRKSFRLIYNDSVDRLTAPIENRYSKAEIVDWFSRAGFCKVEFSESSPYWKACGQLCEP